MKLLISLLFGVFIALFLTCSSKAFGTDVEFIADDYAHKAHDAFVQDEFSQSGELYEKAYAINPLGVYLENALTAYLQQAFNLLQEKDYNNAIKYCEKTMCLSPDNEEALEILSDIYCSRGSGYYYSGNRDRARDDLEKAYKYGVQPEQRQKAQELLTEIGSREGRDCY